MKSSFLRKIPVISTEHMPNTDPFDLFHESQNVVVIAKYDAGYFVHIGECTQQSREELNVLPWLSKIAEWAWDNHGGGTSWIAFDSVGDTIPELTSYHW